MACKWHAAQGMLHRARRPSGQPVHDMAYAPLPSAPAEFVCLHSRHSTLVIEVPCRRGAAVALLGPAAGRWHHARRGAARDAAAAGLHARPRSAAVADARLRRRLVRPERAAGAPRRARLLAGLHAAANGEWHARTRTAPSRCTTTRRGCAHRPEPLQLDADSDVLRLQTTLTNTGSAPLDVQWLAAATLPLPDHCVRVRSFAGQHNHEFLLQVDDLLSRSQWRRENRRGRTSHDCHPARWSPPTGATEADAGLVYGAHLAWSGNHQQTIEWLHDGQLPVAAGRMAGAGRAACWRPAEPR